MKLLILASLLLLPGVICASSELPDGERAEYVSWIEDMKLSARGPFKNIRWFCNDGSVLPPRAYACSEHGGGYQHGAYSERTQTLRDSGFYIANFLVDLDPKEIIQQATFNDRYNQILLEKFLVYLDDGWILRQARYYRGAVQEENERKAARRLLTALSAQSEWISYRYQGLRIGARMLPHGKDSASVQKVRQLAESLAEKDPIFREIRIKIHGSPEAGDANLVRTYAEGITDTREYLELADEIDAIYRAPPLTEALRSNARAFIRSTWLRDYLNQTADALEENNSSYNQYIISSTLLSDLRDFLPRISHQRARLRLIDLSLNIEAVNFKASTELRPELEKQSRRKQIKLLKSAALSSYGAGAINKRSLQQIQQSIIKLDHPKLTLKDYREELGYLGRVPGWGTQSMRFQFYQSMKKLGNIEPLAYRFIQDHVRAGPLLFFSQVLNHLSIDLNRLSDAQHTLFGKQIGVGFKALNPGLVRGRLYTDIKIDDIAAIDPEGIYLLPETVSNLPPISGIITAGAGNPLSHVQLLARNLGIPNITVDESLIAELAKHNGEIIVLAVSPSGLVEINADSGKWRDYFGNNSKGQEVVIRPDIEKLDIDFHEFVDLKQLRAKDSGRIVGPKAAKLGELKYIYPNKVANGVAIPFGIFRAAVLEKPYKNTSQTVYDWMRQQYARISFLDSNTEQQKKTSEEFRAELYDTILQTKLDDYFKRSLREALEQTFGSTELGVFVRSDTNIEDLPGFTGAGLNLTLPNVLGFDNLLQSISRVWASPFTRRAFAWRQSLMDQPQYVFPSILLLRSVPNEKSGVMVTEDIDTGDRGVLSIAVNEGVGGAVDGQSAESLRVSMHDASVRVLATATAPMRRQPSAQGGLAKLPASGAETLLQDEEITQLIALARELPAKFPAIVDDQGEPAPADVEFGFLNGQLQLFQLRPFVQNKKVRGMDYLINMDKALRENADISVDMEAVPEQ